MTPLELKIDAMCRLILNPDDTKARKLLVSYVRNESAGSKVSNDPETIIREILLELGAPDHLVGHPYMVEAILLAVEDWSYINNVTCSLYPQLAARFDTTASRMERALRHLIETAWNRADMDVLRAYFGNTVDFQKGKPTNSEFIARISNVVKQRLK